MTRINELAEVQIATSLRRLPILLGLIMFVGVGCSDIDDEPVQPVTGNYDDLEMQICQNSEEPCPSPMTEGVFCCPVASSASCNGADEGGWYDRFNEDGTPIGCATVYDASGGELVRGHHGCLLLVGGDSCLSAGF